MTNPTPRHPGPCDCGPLDPPQLLGNPSPWERQVVDAIGPRYIDLLVTTLVHVGIDVDEAVADVVNIAAKLAGLATIRELRDRGMLLPEFVDGVFVDGPDALRVRDDG